MTKIEWSCVSPTFGVRACGRERNVVSDPSLCPSFRLIYSFLFVFLSLVVIERSGSTTGGSLPTGTGGTHPGTGNCVWRATCMHHSIVVVQTDNSQQKHCCCETRFQGRHCCGVVLHEYCIRCVCANGDAKRPCLRAGCKRELQKTSPKTMSVCSHCCVRPLAQALGRRLSVFRLYLFIYTDSYTRISFRRPTRQLLVDKVALSFRPL